jgi:uracil-DNA glycosylase
MIHDSWLKIIPEYKKILEYIYDKNIDNLEIFPSKDKVLHCLEFFNIEHLKVVIIGQDPYINKGQSMGLCFSVPGEIKIPPSLKNIYKELETDIGINKTNGNLSCWAEQGILLLNRSLTVIESKSNSHKKIWNPFTNKLIENLSNKTSNLVFILWGKDAQSLIKYIDLDKHYILKAGHPSPLSVRFFRGCKHFSKCNEILIKIGKKPINW